MNIATILSIFSGKKTYSAGIVAILTAALAYASGEANIIDALQIIVPAILAMTLRHGMTPTA
jgi:hypothetical protein